MTKNILDLIGDTPIIKLDKINKTNSTILAKVEALNPSGSIKDIMALYMIGVAEERGTLKPGGNIIEVTSGNTGISFAMISSLKGHKFTAVMPAYMSKERRQMMEAFGAEIILTPEEEGFPGAIKKFEELAKQNTDACLPRQFDNMDMVDKVIVVNSDGAVNMARALMRQEGLMVGISSGANVLAALKVARELGENKTIVTILPDRAERYLSMNLF